ncbi:hypothetical protein M433DRAFT_348929 [Acidomyces richmondensis BFW]|nr:MAG: hypothetical protein FE78DRAFT_467375 [Acidomyces sp. 'richmondensis']KYG49169.1 hypothetical protein M433DRAFT_348929 [Acidomyces richmondensis BFW]
MGLADPTNVNLNTASQRDVFCYMEASKNTYDGDLGARISSVFVILVVSSAVTFFPVLSTRVPRLKIPIYAYLFARYFGSGVIVATGFVHLLDPSYYEIGGLTCVGLSAGWNQYSWPPAFAMAAGIITFLLDFAADRWVEKKYGITFMGPQSGATQANCDAKTVDVMESSRRNSRHNVDRQQATDLEAIGPTQLERDPRAVLSAQPHYHASQPDTSGAMNDNDVKAISNTRTETESDVESFDKDRLDDLGFKQQITAFLVLEFGVIFHSVIIGLTLGAAGSEFPILYIVIIFHQSFEGMGVGARLSSIPFPRRHHWWPWALCAAYGLTTPISIAIGLGVRTTFNPNSYTANVVTGVLDALSGGILIYTGFVELLARDFLYNPDRIKDDKKLAFMAICVLLGAALMAFLGKWI